VTSFDWNVLTVSLAAALGVCFIAMTALRLRTTRRRAQLAQFEPETNEEDRGGGD
jgi:hypothetical protein